MEVGDEPRTRLDGSCFSNQRRRRKSLFRRGLMVWKERDEWMVVRVDVGLDRFIKGHHERNTELPDMARAKMAGV